MSERRSLRIAVEGCGHGTLDSIYASVATSCRIKGWDGVDMLIIGGDFQAVRNAADLNCMAVPVKYREIGDFHKYYSGERVAPYLTVFVGGNHEASNHLWELYYGGWVAPNIYYLGAANVVRFGALRIAGLSGIWKAYNFRKPHYERLPYNQDDVRSIYHVREVDVRKLLQIRTQTDIGISHDWPRGVEWMGDWNGLFRKKEHLAEDARTGNLGSVAAKLVMEHLKPFHWFSAHLHTKFAAIADHGQNMQPHPQSQPPQALQGTSTATHATNGSTNSIPKIQNEEEIDLDMDDDDDNEGQPVSAVSNASELGDLASHVNPKADSTEGLGEATPDQVTKSTSDIPDDVRAQLPASFSRNAVEITPAEPDSPTTIENATTKFLALDKCLPKRDFLQLLEIEPSSTEASTAEQSTPRLAYDPEWLAITRAFALSEPLQLGDPSANLPRDKGRAYYAPLVAKEEAWVDENLTRKIDLSIPENFEITAPVYDASVPVHTRDLPKEYNNPQTRAFCEMLGIENPFWATEEEVESRLARGPRPEERRDGGRGGGRGGRGGGRGHRGRGFGGRGRGRGGRGRGMGG